MEEIMKRARRTHSPEFKAKVAQVAVRVTKHRADLAEPFDLLPIQKKAFGGLF
jgi:transposase-like protein